uniref:Uncharacterized protein n=1 Tax=Octopus bimaculoides TaxID=37653 RepID=A0A0L8GVR3_OCTBM
MKCSLASRQFPDLKFHSFYSSPPTLISLPCFLSRMWGEKRFNMDFILTFCTICNGF